MSRADPCPRCGGSMVVQGVPKRLRTLLDGEPATVRVCESCLSVIAAPGAPVDRDWVPSDLTTELPADSDAAVAVALLVTRLDSLALNRDAIVSIVSYLEEAGVDPLLAIDRLATDPAVDPVADLDRRRGQLAQVVGDT